MAHLCWPTDVRYRAFIAPAIPRLDVYASIASGEDDLLVALGQRIPPTLVNMRPDGRVVAVEHLFGTRRDLTGLLELPAVVVDEDTAVHAHHITSSMCFFDAHHALLEFLFEDGRVEHARAVCPKGSDIWLLFDRQSRWSGVLFTDTVHDDTLSAIEAWDHEHNFSED